MLFASVLLALSVAPVTPAVPYPLTTTVPAAADKDPVYCQLVWQLRSRIPKKVCAPQSWWDAIADVNQTDVREAFRKIKGVASGTGIVGRDATN